MHCQNTSIWSRVVTSQLCCAVTSKICFLDLRPVSNQPEREGEKWPATSSLAGCRHLELLLTRDVRDRWLGVCAVE